MGRARSVWAIGLGLGWSLGAAVAAGEVDGERQRDLGRQAILGSMVGCFQVDYSFAEVEALQAGYQLDRRVYDATVNRQVKELVMVLADSGDAIKLQHILFAGAAEGSAPVFIMKHFGEHWSYNHPTEYSYQGQERWTPRSPSVPEAWTRAVTSLEDAPRYDCTGLWQEKQGLAEWSCQTFAPIPGRETRDMGRHDYQALQRTSRILAYPWGNLERQDNVKTRVAAAGEREPIARELGKTFAIKLPRQHCEGARQWAEKRRDFWALTRQLLDEDFVDGQKDFVMAVMPQGTPPLYVSLLELEEEYHQKIGQAEVASEAKDKLRKLISSYLKP